MAPLRVGDSRRFVPAAPIDRSALQRAANDTAVKKRVSEADVHDAHPRPPKKVKVEAGDSRVADGNFQFPRPQVSAMGARCEGRVAAASTGRLGSDDTSSDSSAPERLAGHEALDRLAEYLAREGFHLGYACRCQCAS